MHIILKLNRSLNMSQALGHDKKILIFSFVTAATTAIAGIYHLQMAPGSLSHNLGEGILFLVGGILQVFWAVPVVKRWGKIWQIIGIAGTVIFIILWLSDRLHLFPEGGGPSGHMPPRGNFTGGEFPKGSPPKGLELEIGGILVPPIEMFQIAFVGLYTVLSKMVSSRQRK
jgi:hypothetical protein